MTIRRPRPGVATHTPSATTTSPRERTVSGHPVTLVSTHGAGDCFIGTLVAALAGWAALNDAAASANLAASRHVSRPRTDTAPG